MKSILLFLMALIMSSCTTLTAKAKNLTEIDKYLEALNSGNIFRGSISVIRNDKLIYEKSLGPSETTSSIFRIGSITKTYLATITLRLVEDEVISLKDTVSTYFPKFPKGSKITVDQLLKHTSGLRSITSTEEYWSYFQEKQSRKELLSKVVKAGFSFEPGVREEYSNSGYIVLTMLIEKATNKSFSELLDKYISGPLGVSNTYVYSKDRPKDEEVPSYVFTGDWYKSTNSHDSVPLGAGAIVSTSYDVALFINSLIKGRIVSKESLDLMKSSSSKVGYGLFQDKIGEEIGHGHTGGIDSFVSRAFHYTDSDTTIVVLSNGQYFSQRKIFETILSALKQNPIASPKIPNIVPVPTRVAKKYIGKYSSKTLPLDIFVSLKHKALHMQAVGQSEIVLIPLSETKFEHAPAGINIVFTSKDSFELHQGNKVYIYKKNKK